MITAAPQALSVHFDDTIVVEDLETYDAGDGDYLLYFPDTGSGIKLINIEKFSAGDAIQVEKDYEISAIDTSDTTVDILFGTFGKGWVAGFSGLDAQIVSDVTAAGTLEDRLQTLKAHWGSDFYFVTE